MTDDLLALLRAAGAEGISSTPNAIDGMRYQTKANALCAEAAAEIERLQRVIASIPQLRPGQLQEDTNTPGLIIRCDTIGQRAAISNILLDAAAALADAPGPDE